MWTIVYMNMLPLDTRYCHNIVLKCHSQFGNSQAMIADAGMI